MFDWENAIAWHAMQGIRASSRGEGEVSWVFSSCGRHIGYSRVTMGMPILNGVCLVKSGHLSRYDGHFGKLN